MKKGYGKAKSVLIAAAGAVLLGCSHKTSEPDSIKQESYGSFWEDFHGKGSKEQGEVIKLADFLAEDNPANQMLNEVMKPMLDEEMDGRYILEVYADGDLGGEEDFLKGIKRGTIEMGIAGVEMSEDFPALKVLDFPFVFEDIDSSFQALCDEEVMEAINRAIEPAGVVCKGFVLTGVRAISNDVRPIESPEDCRGLTLRTPDVTQFIDYARYLGFETVNASVPEIFTVLQQKQADGQENPPLTFLTSGWYQVQKYLSLTNHQITYNWLAVNKEFYDSLTEEDREKFDQCCRAYTETVKERYKEREASVLARLKELGVEVIEVDREPFRAIGLEIIDEYCRKYPEFQKMLEMLRQKGAK